METIKRKRSKKKIGKKDLGCYSPDPVSPQQRQGCPPKIPQCETVFSTFGGKDEPINALRHLVPAEVSELFFGENPGLTDNC